MEMKEKIEIKESLKEISKQVQDVGRMIGSVRILGPSKETEPRFDLEGLNSLRKALKGQAKALNIYIKLLKNQED